MDSAPALVLGVRTIIAAKAGGMRHTGFESWLYRYVALGSKLANITSLTLSFLSCKIELTILLI